MKTALVFAFGVLCGFMLPMRQLTVTSYYPHTTYGHSAMDRWHVRVRLDRVIKDTPG